MVQKEVILDLYLVSVESAYLRQVKIASLSDSVYLEDSSSYILSSILEIFAVYRENLVTSEKTTVSLCDAPFDLSIRVRVNQWDCRKTFDKVKRNNSNSGSGGFYGKVLVAKTKANKQKQKPTKASKRKS